MAATNSGAATISSLQVLYSIFVAAPNWANGFSVARGLQPGDLHAPPRSRPARAQAPAGQSSGNSNSSTIAAHATLALVALLNNRLAAVIQQHLQTLKLPAFRRSYEGLARQAGAEGWPYEDYLREPLDAVVQSRQQRAAASRLREAHFPDIKTLDQIDWQALSGISRPKILELASCDYIERAEAVVFAGPICTGKTHLAIALGVEAARRHRCAEILNDPPNWFGIREAGIRTYWQDLVSP